MIAISIRRMAFIITLSSMLCTSISLSSESNVETDSSSTFKNPPPSSEKEIDPSETQTKEKDSTGLPTEKSPDKEKTPEEIEEIKEKINQIAQKIYDKYGITVHFGYDGNLLEHSSAVDQILDPFRSLTGETPSLENQLKGISNAQDYLESFKPEGIRKSLTDIYILDNLTYSDFEDNAYKTPSLLPCFDLEDCKPMSIAITPDVDYENFKHELGHQALLNNWDAFPMEEWGKITPPSKYVGYGTAHEGDPAISAYLKEGFISPHAKANFDEDAIMTFQYSRVEHEKQPMSPYYNGIISQPSNQVFINKDKLIKIFRARINL